MLVDAHGRALDPKLRAEQEKPQLGWIVCKMLDAGVYVPVMDNRTNALGIAPTAKDAEDLANMLCQRELQPKPGSMVKPGQVSSTYVILKLTGEATVQVAINSAEQLNGGARG